MISEERPLTLMNERYVLSGLLGAGGMATVYRAYDRNLRVTRAIKILSPALAQNATIRSRFESEAQTMARLHHANILAVHDVGVDGDTPFIVMDLAHGGCLQDQVDVGPPRPGVACDVMIAVLAALQHAHERGVVHRDVKPQNILLSRDGAPMVSDFGIARVTGADNMTRTGLAVGTPSFMAPEQLASARSADCRADVYAAGVTLYVLLTGSPAIPLYTTEVDDALAEFAFSQMHPDLSAIVRMATRFKPQDRYATAAAMIAALVAVRPQFSAEPADALRPAHPLEDSVEPPGGSSVGNPTAVFWDDDGKVEVSNAATGAGSMRRRSSAIAAAGVALCGAVGLGVWGTQALLDAPAPAAVESTSAAPPAAPALPTTSVTDAPPRLPEPVSSGVLAAPAGAPTAPAAAPVKALSSARKAVPVEKGTVILNSIPWSQISIDGKPTGRTGWTGELAAGSHEVTFDSSDGRRAVRSLDVLAHESVTLCWDFHEESQCRR